MKIELDQIDSQKLFDLLSKKVELDLDIDKQIADLRCRLYEEIEDRSEIAKDCGQLLAEVTKLKKELLFEREKKEELLYEREKQANQPQLKPSFEVKLLRKSNDDLVKEVERLTNLLRCAREGNANLTGKVRTLEFGIKNRDRTIDLLNRNIDELKRELDHAISILVGDE